MKNKFVILFLFLLLLAGISFALSNPNTTKESTKTTSLTTKHPLQIEEMRKQKYIGSKITIEETLVKGSNYNQYIASYLSEENKIYALLTVPIGEKSKNGWPVIIFNHGYIPPKQYKTTERYGAYVDSFARNGYIVLKPDYRGHGESEGKPLGTYYSPAYTVDVLNAVASIKKFKDADSNRIGMWGHSMGGHITLRSMVVSKDIKAGVVWAGVVASYEDMLKNWRRSAPWRPSTQEGRIRRPTRQEIINKYGTPEENPSFWQSISPIYFVKDISGPVQIHHGIQDSEVPWEFSQSLEDSLKKAGKSVEFYKYEGADHNISGEAFNIAMERSIRFFDKYLK